jgi:hypothetical protein
MKTAETVLRIADPKLTPENVSNTKPDRKAIYNMLEDLYKKEADNNSIKTRLGTGLPKNS